jgi:hypothetical protein
MFAVLASENNSTSMTVTRLGGRYVNSGIPVEKSIRNQHESSVFGRHNWIVLNTNIVSETEAMPQSHISVSYGAVIRSE